MAAVVYLTLRMLAQHLACSPRTARRLIASGVFPVYRITPRSPVRVRLEDVEAYMESRRQEPTQPTLKSRLAAISARVLAERRKTAS